MWRTLVGVLGLSGILLVSGVPVDPGHDTVPGEYIISLKPEVVSTHAQQTAVADELRQRLNVDVRASYHVRSVRMFHVVAEHLHPDVFLTIPEVKYVVPNTIMHIRACSEQPHPENWGDDRIDQRDALPYTDPGSTASTYIHDVINGAGENVDVYVVDTGIDITHPDFGGRAIHGYTEPQLGEGEGDGNGHGTHLAGTVGSTTYGVAKSVRLIAVKVLSASGSGSTAWILNGMQWVFDQFTANGGQKSVMNMAIGGSKNQGMDDLLKAICDGGVSSVVSAGSSVADTCNFSPAGVAEAITVGSSDILDTAVSSSNYGPCTNIFAPGGSVKSLWLGGGYATISGSSSATAHVSGVVARYMSLLPYTPTAQSMMDYVISVASNDKLDFGGDPIYDDTPNKLVYVDCNMPNSTVPLP